MKNKVLISNLVYGDPYTQIFLDLHLKSLIENCGDSPFSKSSIYLIYTDGKNIDRIKNHENFKVLTRYFRTQFITISSELRYDRRYSIQTVQLQHSLKVAIENSALMQQACADVYYGSNFWRNAIELINDKSVQVIFGNAIRSAYETTSSLLMGKQVSNDELFDIALSNLHPLWLSCNWEAPLFSRIPYHIIWTRDEQIICRSFSMSPLIFEPSANMLTAGGCSDITLRRYCDKIHFERDWQNAPIIELGMLSAFYPPFGRGKASVSSVASWAISNVLPENHRNIELFQVIKKTTTRESCSLISETEDIANSILGQIEIRKSRP